MYIICTYYVQRLGHNLTNDIKIMHCTELFLLVILVIKASSRRFFLLSSFYFWLPFPKGRVRALKSFAHFDADDSSLVFFEKTPCLTSTNCIQLNLT